jgi:hypothetical protein
MKKIISLLSAGALAISMSLPVMAAPQGFGHGKIFNSQEGSNVINVRDHGRRVYRTHNRHHRRHHRGFSRHGGYGWYNGHRGYRHHRHGYREYNGWWFPATAFLGAAIIGNAIANAPRGGNAHVEWCYNRYRSYRASDNTYQPYNGPRRQCRSPY